MYVYSSAIEWGYYWEVLRGLVCDFEFIGFI